jgi:S-adenosyl methyltransferase
MYDYWRGGTNDYAADRRKADEIERWYPAVRQMVTDNSAFAGRAVTWTAREGISCYLEMGSRLSAAGGIHGTARAAHRQPAAVWVAYVDRDPEVIEETERILDKDGREGVAVVWADLRAPAAVLGEQGLKDVIEPGEPVCVILTLVLHFMPPCQARELVAGYVRELRPGSLVVIGVPRNDDSRSFREVRAAWPDGDLYNHTRQEIAGFFGDLEMIPPGLVVARGWRGGKPAANVPPDGRLYVLGGVGRKLITSSGTNDVQGAALRSTRTWAAAISASYRARTASPERLSGWSGTLTISSAPDALCPATIAGSRPKVANKWDRVTRYCRPRRRTGQGKVPTAAIS